jgi:hypothetical protein
MVNTTANITVTTVKVEPMEKNKLIVKSVLLVIVIFVIIFLLISLIEDDAPPSISFSNADAAYYEGESTQELLADVKAYDKRDGDVSDTLMVESVQTLSDGTQVSVIYAARDTKNNIAKKTRTLKIGDTGKQDDQNSTKSETDGSTDGKIPVITMNTNAVTISAGGSFNPMNYVENATDDVDDAWKKIHIDGDYDTNVRGDYSLKYYIIDSEGNKSNVEEFTLTVE